jgi:hypothetical protein
MKLKVTQFFFEGKVEIVQYGVLWAHHIALYSTVLWGYAVLWRAMGMLYSTVLYVLHSDPDNSICTIFSFPIRDFFVRHK